MEPYKSPDDLPTWRLIFTAVSSLCAIGGALWSASNGDAAWTVLFVGFLAADYLHVISAEVTATRRLAERDARRNCIVNVHVPKRREPR